MLDLWRAALRSLVREPRQAVSQALYRAQTRLDRAEPLRALAVVLSPCPPCGRCGQPTIPDRLVEVEAGRVCIGCLVRATWEREVRGQAERGCGSAEQPRGEGDGGRGMSDEEICRWMGVSPPRGQRSPRCT
jgi:hypothetical protein